jgi:hypothetical protein
MHLWLGIIAIIIWLIYLIYFVQIIKGSPQAFELELLRSLADWIISQGANSKKLLWIVLGASIGIEILYFCLTLRIVSNPFLINLTFLIILFEIYHLFLIIVNLQRFFSGRFLLGQIFDWRVERSSACLFFTHTLLVIVVLISTPK